MTTEPPKPPDDGSGCVDAAPLERANVVCDPFIVVLEPEPPVAVGVVPIPPPPQPLAATIANAAARPEAKNFIAGPFSKACERHNSRCRATIAVTFEESVIVRRRNDARCVTCTKGVWANVGPSPLRAS